MTDTAHSKGMAGRVRWLGLARDLRHLPVRVVCLEVGSAGPLGLQSCPVSGSKPYFFSGRGCGGVRCVWAASDGERGRAVPGRAAIRRSSRPCTCWPAPGLVLGVRADDGSGAFCPWRSSIRTSEVVLRFAKNTHVVHPETCRQRLGLSRRRLPVCRSGRSTSAVSVIVASAVTLWCWGRTSLAPQPAGRGRSGTWPGCRAAVRTRARPLGIRSRWSRCGPGLRDIREQAADST